MKYYYLVLLALCSLNLSAQIVNIPDASFKAVLVAHTDPVIDANTDGEIQVSEALATNRIIVPPGDVASLEGIESFENLLELYVEENDLLTAIDLSFLDEFEILQLDMNNGLTTVDFSGVLNAGFINVRDCSALTTLLLPDLETVSGTEIIGLSSLVDLDLGSLTTAGLLNLSFNALETLDISNLASVFSIDLFGNLLSSLDVSSLSGSMDQFILSENPISELILPDATLSINFLDLFATGFVELDLSTVIINDVVTLIDCDLLEFLSLKNGAQEQVKLPFFAPLAYICADPEDLDYLTDVAASAGLTETTVGTYCDFTPGGEYYTVEGDIFFDFEPDCLEGNLPAAFERVTISNTIGDTFATTSDEEGFYSIFVFEDDTYTLEADLEYDGIFITTPATYTINIPADIPDISIPFIANFCLAPDGVVDDVAVYIAPTGPARPGFDASYRLILENLGNSILDGQLSFSYDEELLDLVETSEPPTVTADGLLTFDYAELAPFESRSIEIILNVNAPTDIPPVNNDDVLTYSAEVLPNPDENPEDNTFTLEQIVVGSFDPNDKTCLQGETITPQEVGEYVDYLIRFENTGTFAAENVVVTDTINTDYFQLQSLRVIGASHDFVTRVTDNFVEFIFEDINLPFDDANNDGYVLFKIRTLETLEVGDSFSNNAAIYFDFNFPIITNEAVTTIEEPLSVDEFNADSLRIYPNPTLEILNISGSENSELKSIKVYNLQGQLLIDQQGNQGAIEVSGLSVGVYLIEIETIKGSLFKRFVKN